MRELRASGAKLYLATGHVGFGRYVGAQHRKGAIMDDKVAWSGGANLTRASRVNREMVHWFENGPAVVDTLELLQETVDGATMLKILG